MVRIYSDTDRVCKCIRQSDHVVTKKTGGMSRVDTARHSNEQATLRFRCLSWRTG